MKFKIGDHIAANELSNGQYSVTCLDNGWVGYVTELFDRGEFSSGDIGVLTDSLYESGYSDTEFIVDSEYFDIIPEEEIDAPDEDLFESLFA